MPKEVEMSVRDTIDLDAALAQFLKERIKESEAEPKEEQKSEEEKDDSDN